MSATSFTDWKSNRSIAFKGFSLSESSSHSDLIAIRNKSRDLFLLVCNRYPQSVLSDRSLAIDLSVDNNHQVHELKPLIALRSLLLSHCTVPSEAIEASARDTNDTNATASMASSKGYPSQSNDANPSKDQPSNGNMVFGMKILSNLLERGKKGQIPSKQYIHPNADYHPSGITNETASNQIQSYSPIDRNHIIAGTVPLGGSLTRESSMSICGLYCDEILRLLYYAFYHSRDHQLQSLAVGVIGKLPRCFDEVYPIKKGIPMAFPSTSPSSSSQSHVSDTFIIIQAVLQACKNSVGKDYCDLIAL